MNAEEYEHIWFWEQPKLFCKVVEEEFLKKVQKEKDEEFKRKYSIDILKEINDKHGCSKN